MVLCCEQQADLLTDGAQLTLALCCLAADSASWQLVLAERPHAIGLILLWQR